MTEPKESKRIRVVHKRQPSDNYATQFEIAKWTVDHCLELSQKYCGIATGKLQMLEPGCGDNAPFSRYAASVGMSAYGIDSRNVQTRDTVTVFPEMNFLDLPSEETRGLYARKYDIIATNPPFNIGCEFVNRSLDILSPRGVAAFLVKLSFLGSKNRSDDLFDSRPPFAVHVLIKRPSFAYGATDRGQEYCIALWAGSDLDKALRRNRGKVPRLYWERNGEWEVPVLPDGQGTRIQVEKYEPEDGQ